MGRAIKRSYLGAYFDITDDKFQEIKNSDIFYNQIGEENFIYAYQGLESINVLIPKNDNGYSEFLTIEEDEIERVITSVNFKNEISYPKIKKLNDDFKEIIEKLELFFKKIEIRYGFITFWDEN